MPPRGTPRKRRGAGDYTAIGERGRRTGAQLKVGKKDEHGLEEVPSFSSPEKGVPQTNGNLPEEITNLPTYTADDSMDVDQSTAPEPTDLIKTVKNAQRRSLPRSVSPIKTGMRGAPRRSIPRMSEPVPSSPSNQLLNGTSHIPEPSLDDTEIEPIKPPPLTRPKRGRPKTARKDKTKGPFDLSVEDDEPDTTINSIDPSAMVTDEYALPGDDPLPEGDTQQEDAIMEDAEPDTTAGSAQPIPFPAGKTIQESEVAAAPSKGKPRGRPGRKPAAQRDKEATAAASTSAPGKGKRKAPLAEKDTNRILKAPRASSKAPPSRAGSVQPASSRFAQRAETPATDNGAFQTRSGRTSLKPLASWKGEKVIYGPRKSINTLPSIDEIVRIEEMPPPERPKRYYNRGGPKRGRRAGTAQRDIGSEMDEDEELEPWEESPGIQQAMVMSWDPAAETYSEDGSELTEIAYAATAIEMRDIQHASFKFAKTLTLPFFGSGMVHLPPGGEKRIKNSRKMQMVFFVFYGRVTVNVGTPTSTFSIGKGGQWQVPRGNFYSIINESRTAHARLFFAQGCQWNGDTDESTVAE